MSDASVGARQPTTAEHVKLPESNASAPCFDTRSRRVCGRSPSGTGHRTYAKVPWFLDCGHSDSRSYRFKRCSVRKFRGDSGPRFETRPHTHDETGVLKRTRTLWNQLRSHIR